MRTSVAAAGLAAFALAAVSAHAAETRRARSEAAAADPAPVPALPAAPPKVFQAAGYSQPDITPGLCKTVGPKETRCQIPPMTAGRYIIVASGSSTATGDGAMQAIDIRLDSAGDEQVCAKAQTNPKAPAPWKDGKRTIRIGCIVQFIADDGMVVRATYADAHANPDATGPTLAFRKVPWSPIWNAVAAPVQVAAPPAPASH